MGDDPDLYRLLEVQATADRATIRASYRRMARLHHPDVNGSADDARRMSQINRAWEILRDPVHRAAYDEARLTPAEAYVPGRHASREPTGSAQAGRASAARPPAPSATDTPSPPRAPRPSPRPSASPSPPGPPSRAGGRDGTVLQFGRYAGWSLGQLARHDPEFLEWLERTPSGRPFRDEIDALLRRLGRRSAQPDPLARPGRFRG